MELVVKDRVPTFSKDQDIVIPVLDWLYGLLYRNGEYTWRSLNLNRFQYIRHHRMNDRDMTRNAIANTRELILGHISEADAEEVIALMKKGGEDDNALVPSPAFSLDTESVQMYASDWNYLCANEVAEQAETLPKFPRQVQGLVSHIAFIILGNGSTWNVILRFPYVGEAKNKKDNITNDHFKLRFTKRPLDSGSRRILSFLSKKSVAFGCNIYNDLKEIKDSLWELYKYPWSPPKALDISSMFILAGYDQNHHNMAILSYLLLGVVMNKRVSEMNNLWAFMLSDLEARDPDLGSLWYVFNDIRCGFNMMAVCFNWLFYEAFPDPATVLTAVKTSEDDWRNLFLLAISKAIGDRVPVFDRLESAQRSRLHRMYTLSGYSKRYSINSTELGLISDLYDLFPCAPHGTLGGPRYVEPFREHFALKTVPALIRLFSEELSSGTCIVNLNHVETESPEWIFKTMLGHKPNARLAYVQEGTRKPGLTVHPELKGLVANFNQVSTVKEISHERDLRTYIREMADVACSAGEQNYDVSLTIKEGGFHTPERLPVILDNMEKEYEENIRARKAGETKFELVPNLGKHALIKRMYEILTGERIGSVKWENMKIENARKMVTVQKRAVKKDPNRDERINVMEAAMQEVENVAHPQSIDPMGQITQNIPSPEATRRRNQKNNQRKRA